MGNFCFRILIPVFLEFKKTKFYSYFKAKVRSHNRVKADDFEFLKIMGKKDCTDRIFQVRKKSTNKKLVMRVKRKVRMRRRRRNQLQHSTTGAVHRTSHRAYLL